MHDNKKNNLKVSIIITSYNDNKFLDFILKDLQYQDFPTSKFEILLLEAGNYSLNRAKNCLGQKKSKLKFFNKKKWSRTLSLNYLVSIASNELIIRLDARTRINHSYISDIVNLANKKIEANVGGVLVPIGLSKKQIEISNIMKSPFFFGNGEFRRKNYRGYVSSVYLGAFRKSLMIKQPWFDEKNNLISEDSDLNYQIYKNGGRVYLDSSIKVEHYCRETLKEFFLLCYNYGFGRGLFIRKHKNFSAVRQIIPPTSLILFILLFLTGLYIKFLHITLFILILIYFVLITYAGVILKPTNIIKLFRYIGIFFLGHFIWTVGFMLGVFRFKS